MSTCFSLAFRYTAYSILCTVTFLWLFLIWYVEHHAYAIKHILTHLHCTKMHLQNNVHFSIAVSSLCALFMNYLISKFGEELIQLHRFRLDRKNYSIGLFLWQGHSIILYVQIYLIYFLCITWPILENYVHNVIRTYHTDIYMLPGCN